MQVIQFKSIKSMKIQIMNTKPEDHKMIHNTLMAMEDLKLFINKDIANEITNYAIEIKMNCIECNKEYALNEELEWSQYYYATAVNPNIFFSKELNAFIKPMCSQENKYDIMCRGCHRVRQCTDCGRLIWKTKVDSPSGNKDKTHCNGHALCNNCSDYYVKKLGAIRRRNWLDIDKYEFCAKCKFKEFYYYNS